MKIIGVLRRAACPSGDDCDTVYDTDGPDLLVRGRILDAADVDALGMQLPAHEGVLRLSRALAPEVTGDAQPS